MADPTAVLICKICNKQPAVNAGNCPACDNHNNRAWAVLLAPTTTAQCPVCAATIQLTRKPYTYAWDGEQWTPKLWTPWAGRCPNQCGFVSGQALFSYGLRPREIGKITL